MKTLSLLALCLPIACASAAPWAKLSKVIDGEATLDTGSISKNRAWTKTVYAHNHSTPGGKNYIMSMTLHLYACEERTSTIQTQLFYAGTDATATPVETLKFEKFVAEDIVPDTPNDAALKKVCEASAKKP